MRVLVTGGAGFIGSVTAAALLDAGHEVTVLDDLRAGSADRVPDGAHFVRASLSDLPAIEAALRDRPVQAVIHFAASLDVAESMQAPERYFAGNTAATLALFPLLVDLGVTRLVFSSTAAVYGEPQRTPIEEDHPTAPASAYGASKLLAEQALRWMADRDRLSFVALRYFNAAGAVTGQPEQHHPETHLIPLALDAAAGRRGPLRVFGTDYPTPDGTAIRDYVHVSDLAAAHVAALDHLADGPDTGRSLVANLGTGTGYSVREVLTSVGRVTGLPVPAQDAPRRPGDPAVLVASPERARRVLDWSPRRSDLDVLVRDAWQTRAPLGEPTTEG